jgi:hypothetical protein
LKFDHDKVVDGVLLPNFLESTMKNIVAKYFEYRRQFPSMAPASCWFHASVEIEIIELHAGA